MDERQVALRDEVETATSLVRAFVAEAAAGRLPEAEAQERARTALRALRFGKGDYFLAYRYDGVNVVHGLRPENEGRNLLSAADANGVHFNEELIAAARRGGGYVAFMFPRAGHSEPSPKLGYAAAVEPWGWVVGTGAYIDERGPGVSGAAGRGVRLGGRPPHPACPGRLPWSPGPSPAA